jgi:hypothetical protein
MTRPSPDSPTPYTRSQVARITGAPPPLVQKLGTEVLKKRARGTGNHLGFSMEDALRIMVARELMRTGVQVSSLDSLFKRIEDSPAASARRWAWLRNVEERSLLGAAIVLILPQPHAADSTANCFLTTALEAVEIMKTAKRTVVVVDVGALIVRLEEHTGQRYM